MNSIIKLGVAQANPLVDEANQILNLDQIFGPLVNASAFRAVSNSAVVNEGAAVIIDVAANDQAPDFGLNLNSIVIVDDVDHGATVVNGDGTVTYTHDDSENLSDSFTYTIQNNNGDTSNIATVSINVNSVNDNAPVFTSAVTRDVAENTVFVMNVTATDADNSPLTFSINGTGADDSKFSISASGALSFIAAPDFEVPGDVGADNIYNVDVNVTDGVFNVVHSIAVTVTAANDAPVAFNDSFEQRFGTTATLYLAANDTDVDNALDLTSVVIVSQPSQGFIAVNNDGTVDYTNTGSGAGADQFSYTIKDVAGLESNVATVDITISDTQPSHVSLLLDASITYNGCYVRDADWDMPGSAGTYKVAFRPQYTAGNIEIRLDKIAVSGRQNMLRVVNNIAIGFDPVGQIWYVPFVAGDLVEIERIVTVADETWRLLVNGVQKDIDTGIALGGDLKISMYGYTTPSVEWTDIRFYENGEVVPVIFGSVAQMTATIGQV